ncbi:probable receptor-like protein kinase At5g24010 [Humulus lupulus]|uniref:probable receptor-like protein kinase At5g24010 n=1 Tax=Humulus lupulus TaxID=3486 RepID=UPI002B411333|nr:probable receptor-like protein kinase At5g24010 [Humulus lupulus]
MLSSSHLVFFPFFILIIHFSSLLILSLSESDYTRPDKYFIACGSKSNVTTNERQSFVGDRAHPPFFLSPGRSKAIITDETSNDMSSLYKTARVIETPSSYELEVDQDGTYMVRLHFHSFPSEFNLSEAFFDVLASGYSLLSNFSVRTQSVEEFLLPIKKGKFKLYFQPSQNSLLAFVNAIEVFLVPEEDLLPKSAQLITLDGTKGIQSDLISLVYRTIHRINVGGKTVTPESDFLWRTWLQDDGFLIKPEAAKKSQYYDGTLKFLPGGSTKYSAPEYVYRTGRELNVQADFSKATWAFPVSKSANKHLVRVHLCDIIGKALSVFDFTLFIYNKLERTIDAYDDIGNLQSPFHLDYVVDTNGSGFINISIGLVASNNWSSVPNAYLNGVEIFEIERTSSIAVFESPLKQNGSVIGFGSFVAFLVIIGMLISVLMVLKSKTAKFKRYAFQFLYEGMSSDRPKIDKVEWALRREGFEDTTTSTKTSLDDDDGSKYGDNDSNTSSTQFST